MALFGYHASHEQFTPFDLLRWTILAERCGIKAVNCSDHFHPWSEAQGQSGFSFAWLGAAMQATTIPFGVVVTPGYRYHPATLAQAAATLSEMFPERFSMALGSGEALNENITGKRWPLKGERNARLKECYEVMSALFRGEMVTHRGLIKIQEAKLYTLPAKPPQMIGAAVTKNTASWMGSWAEGLITISHPLKELAQVVDAFRSNGGKKKPIYLKVQLSYAETREKALKGAHHQWRANVLPAEILDDLWLPKQYDAAAKYVRPEDVEKSVLIGADAKIFIDQLQAYRDIGFDVIILHNVNRDQERFIRFFGEKVLPFV